MYHVVHTEGRVAKLHVEAGRDPGRSRVELSGALEGEDMTATAVVAAAADEELAAAGGEAAGAQAASKEGDTSHEQLD